MTRPELVAIEMPLAGIGSRFIALLVDYLIWAAGFLCCWFSLAIVLARLKRILAISEQWAVADLIFSSFCFNWGYFTLFEAFWNGRTPGKRVARIRVIQRSGRAIGLFESMARNLVRYIDQIPFFYAVGVIAMFCHAQHQRLGDLAAGTLVVRDREEEAPLWAESGARTFTAPSLHCKRPGSRAAFCRHPARHRNREALLSRPGGAGGIFVASAGYEPGDAAALAERIASAIQAKSGLEAPAGRERGNVS